MSSVYRLVLVFDHAVSIKLFDIILPVGDFFLYFSSYDYIIDVYRGDTQAEYNVINFVL